MIIENRALWLARSFTLSLYNHRAVIITLKPNSFKMAARFVDVSESEIDQFKENASEKQKKLQIINAILLKQLVASQFVKYNKTLLSANIFIALPC